MRFNKGGDVYKAKSPEFCENKHGCWICVSHKDNARGYSKIRRNGKAILLHRYMYEKYVGLIPKGMCVLHHCDNPACNNPDHLFLGTHTDNMRDMCNKNRQARGIHHGSAKLTENQVREIFIAGGTRQAIAQEYGISRRQVSNIKNRKKWNYLQLA